MIKFNFPTPETPGYLRREREYLDFIDSLDASPASIERIIAYLLPYVAEPEDREEARNALMELSQSEYVNALQGVRGRVEIPPQK